VVATDEEQIEDNEMERENNLSALKQMFREPSSQNKEGKLIIFF